MNDVVIICKSQKSTQAVLFCFMNTELNSFWDQHHGSLVQPQMRIFKSYKVAVRQWGNSLAVRIPHEAVLKFGVRRDQKLVMEVSDDGEELVLRIKKNIPLPVT
jgi:hypothetical protein